MKCDLTYPAELHDLHNDYPLAPERMRSTQTSTPHRISVVGGAHLEPHNGVWRVRRRALPKAGRETVKRFGVSQTLDKPGSFHTGEIS